jgi:uncharacterized membrane protein HdeD (DUF308 family)
MDYLQYLLYFGAYIGGVMLHELLHWVVARLLGYNPNIDLFGLSVDYWVPEDKLQHIRLISVAPLVVAFAIGVLVFTFSTLTLMWVLLLVGLVINTSGSDISISRALGHDDWWTNTDSGIRIVCGSAILIIASKIMEYMYAQTNVYGEQLFYFYIADVLSISGILCALIGVCLFFWNNKPTSSESIS